MPELPDRKAARWPPTPGLTDTTFEREVLSAGEAVLADFWAGWGTCRTVAPLLDLIAEEKNCKLTIARLKVDQNPLSAQFQSLRSIP